MRINLQLIWQFFRKKIAKTLKKGVFEKILAKFLAI